MKKTFKNFTIMVLIVFFVFLSISFISCNEDNSIRNENTVLRFASPEGTPALAMLRLGTDNKTIDGTKIEYAVVNPSNIAVEMSSKKADIVIMPVNAGANLIRQGANFKLISIAVNGSLFMVGKTENGGGLTFNDIKGKKIACIGKTGVPGLIFRYVMTQNGINIIEGILPDASNNEVSVEYVGDGSIARTKLADKSVDFAVVGEPASTIFKSSLGLNAEMDMQMEYASLNQSVSNYPQAGLFIKNGLATDTLFINALFSCLKDNREWINANKTSVTEFAKKNLYESAVFPSESIDRCALNSEQIDEKGKNEVITFLNLVACKDINGLEIDWNKYKDKIF